MLSVSEIFQIAFVGMKAEDITYSKFIWNTLFPPFLITWGISGSVSKGDPLGI